MMVMMLASDMLIFHHLITNLADVANGTNIRAICPFGSFMIFTEPRQGDILWTGKV